MGIMLVWTFLAAFLIVVQGSYVITTPRRWIYGQSTSVCVQHVGVTGRAEDHLRVTLTNDQNATVASVTLPITQGQTSKCYQVSIPKRRSRTPLPTPPYGHARGNRIRFEGQLGGRTVFDSRELALEEDERTFLQTDKQVYSPGQVVHFRILTVEGPSMRASTDNYPVVYVETPSGMRVQQWLNVDNARGLVHLQFQLHQEVEEGIYHITVEKNNGARERQAFRVDDYVPPKFEVTLTMPNGLYRNDLRGSVRVCAKYTFGQPVKGNATIFFETTTGLARIRNTTLHGRINGCQNFSFALNESYFHRDLVASASVEEEGTGITVGSSSEEVEIHYQALRFQTTYQDEIVKPGLPATIRVKVTRSVGGEAVPYEPMQVCLKELCKNFTTDAEGVLGLRIPPNAFGTIDKAYERKLTIIALNHPGIKKGNIIIMYKNSLFLVFKSFFSPTNSSLLLLAPEEKLDCKKDGRHQLQLDVMFSAFRQSSANVTVQVISRGQIRYQHTAEYPLVSSSLPLNLEYFVPMEPTEGVVVGSFKIRIPVEDTEAKVLVWYSRDDGEVVSDAALLEFRDCFAPRVEMEWNIAKAEPGQRATLTLGAEPNSLCSYGVVDKSVDLLSTAENSLTVQRISDAFKASRRLGSTFRQSDYEEYCRDKVPGPIGDELTGRDWFIHFTGTIHWDALSSIDDSGLFFITDLTTETRPCVTRDGDIPLSAFLGGSLIVVSHGVRRVGFFDLRTGSAKKEKKSARKYFPETWLWDLSVIPDTGRSEQDFTLPDTVTEWVGRAVCVHPQKGLALSGNASVTTFTPFFAQLTLPPSVKRGEILPVKISVFNYLDRKLPVKMVLENSSDFDILGPEGEEVVAHGERSACVPATEKVTHVVRIRPKETGDLSITVNAFVVPNQCGLREVVTKRDSLRKTIRVEAEGFFREKTWTKYICSKEFENYSDSLEILHLEPPAGTVEGSERAFVTASGDLLGPSLNNLEHLIRMPYGCGEQNMIKFAPNIYILNYLEASRQLKDPIAKRIKKILQEGYQSELKYRHEDASYSAFGSPEDESGSTWLTAFVVKSFTQARHYIFVDQEGVEESMDWLKKQQTNDGCFRSVGRIIHKAMKGGLSTDSSVAPLTAYVLMALLEAGESPRTPVALKAIGCLLQQEQTWSTYTRAITSYALALAQHPEAERVLHQLLQDGTKSTSSLSWESSSGRGVAVEIAGYAVLAMVTIDRVGFSSEILRAVKWFSRMRNGQGGFVSTQDTVVALQALAAFASIRAESVPDLAVTVGAKNVQHTFNINNENRILQQIVKLPTLPTDVSLDMTGQGCALLQAVLRYNVPSPDPTDAFSLQINTKTVADRKCVTKSIDACASYLLPDQKSNMAILEVSLPSGHIPMKEDLKKVVSNSQLFKRFEVDGSKVVLYIDELTNQGLCASFKVTRELNVERAKPGTIRLYDYYQPELSLEKNYVLPPMTECLTNRGPS